MTRRWLTLLWVTLAMAACDGSSVSDDGVGRRTFDPRQYAKGCTTKADCILVTAIDNCASCCSESAVRAADQVTADRQRVEAACAPEHLVCAMPCPPNRAECVAGECVACPERPCNDGIFAEIEITAPGTWRVEAKFDGQTASCAVDLPQGWPGPGLPTCTPGMELLGAERPGNTATFRVATTTTRTIDLRVLHDDAEQLAKTYAPQYVTEPGPNGPQCEPRTCQVARFAVR